MRISKLKISGFKSLVDFEIDLAKFTCLIGLNGSGKSTILQCLDFLSQLAQGNMDSWFKERQWESSDIRTKLDKRQTITYELLFDNTTSFSGTYNVNMRKCTREKIVTKNATLELEDQKIVLHETTGSNGYSERREDVSYTYSGSVTSQKKDDSLPSEIVEVKKHVAQINSFDLLSPESLRRRNRDYKKSIGLGGQHLSSFVRMMMMNPISFNRVIKKLQSIYPQLKSVYLDARRGGWRSVSIAEAYDEEKKLYINARHINDGLLRLLAILSELESTHPFLLFDEIENGINPELVEFLLDAFVDAEKQIMVATHSPLILNYLEDDVARDGVTFIYKTPDGKTQAKPFFKIPSMAEKLAVMGPGEVFADTDLVTLTRELNEERGE